MKPLDIDLLIFRGKTYEMGTLPSLFRATCDREIDCLDDFEELRTTRNAVQHFCAPPSSNLSGIALKGIYNVAAPLLEEYFGVVAVSIGEDQGDDIDYVMDCLVSREIVFTPPAKWEAAEADIMSTLARTNANYRAEMKARFDAAEVTFR